MPGRFFGAAAISAAFLSLQGCDRGPQDVFTSAEIDAFIEEYTETAEVARSTRGSGKPLMWTLSDADTDIHLFGTIHVLPPGLDWRSDAMNEAFEEAHTLVMEVAEGGDDADPDTGVGMLLSGMSETPLQERLSETDYARLEAVADEFGIPMTSLNVMKPWMAAITLEFALIFREGYEDDEGVEVILEKEALKAGKALAGLETAEFQETLFENLSERAQLEYLMGGVASADVATDALDLYLEEWLDGDYAGMNAIASAESYEKHEGYREFYDLLIKNRNEAWIPQIEEMLETPGTIFIAVGAGHLEGPDSVIRMLRDKGYTVEGP